MVRSIIEAKFPKKKSNYLFLYYPTNNHSKLNSKVYNKFNFFDTITGLLTEQKLKILSNLHTYEVHSY